MNVNDTIAAIATASGPAGIAVVRVSGPDTYAIADSIFQCRGKKPSERAAGTFAVGHVVDGGHIIDQALLLVMRAPHSYTGEDVVEFQGHGGSQCAQRILRAALAAGARPAGPGEFTQRAFLNGRLDLVQAEAVLDLIHARSERAAAAALDQLEGGLSRSFEACYDDVMLIASDIEATLDFPEDELPDTVLPDLIRRLRTALDQFDRLLNTWDEGHLLRDGALIVISGKPNVGKSTLLNALLERDRAIVSPTPGTTRDTIEEDMILAGIPVRLVDTAGLRAADNEVEQIGIQRTRRHMEKADLHIHVLDATQPRDEADEATIRDLPKDRTLLLINKKDLTNSENYDISSRAASLLISAVQPDDIRAVKSAIVDLISAKADLQARPHAAISERHRRLLLSARSQLKDATAMLESGQEDQLPLAAAELRGALENLGEVTGKTYHDELLNNIFSRFCIGK